ncbi:MAG: hypothetical protein ACYCZO_10235 [Daejeonella sp.]
MERLLKNNLTIMLNCILAEKRRIYSLKGTIVKYERYEYAAMIHDIDKKLDELIEMLEKIV